MNNAKLQAKIAKLHIKSCPKLAWISPNCRTKKRSGGKIKIGFISTYFRNHSVGKLMVGLILNLPRESFEIFIITQRGQQDKIAKKIEQSADSVIYFSDNFFDIQRDIAELSFDVHIYGDIGMDIRTYFLAFSRLAFVQAVFWGHPDTTGIPAIDYFFSSKLIESPEASEHYTEKLVLFDNLPTYYQRPIVPERLRTRTEFGFDESKTIYFCPQTAFKFHPDIDAVQIGLKLYNRKKQTFEFDDELKCTVVYFREFTEIPETARRYIMVKAARVFVDRLVGDDGLRTFTQQDEIKARAILMETDLSNADHNMLTGDPTISGVFGTYLPSNALIR